MSVPLHPSSGNTVDSLTKGEKITGIIERIIFHNRENGYYVVEILDEDNKSVMTTLNHVKVYEGITMEFYGEWTKHNKYGSQFKCSQAVEIKPKTTDALISYLSSGFFKGIGPVIARKVVDYFGDEALDVFSNDIERILNISGI